MISWTCWPKYIVIVLLSKKCPQYVKNPNYFQIICKIYKYGFFKSITKISKMFENFLVSWEAPVHAGDA